MSNAQYKYTVPKVHNHTQVIASTTWNVTYPFTGTPIVDVMIMEHGVLTKVIPEHVIFPSVGNVQIVFSTAHTGKVRIIA